MTLKPNQLREIYALDDHRQSKKYFLGTGRIKRRKKTSMTLVSKRCVNTFEAIAYMIGKR